MMGHFSIGVILRVIVLFYYHYLISVRKQALAQDRILLHFSGIISHSASGIRFTILQV